jgi:hypothetical protein
VRDYQKRITATFLNSCSPEAAYEWLKRNWKGHDGGIETRRYGFEIERKKLESLLLRRKHPLIDLGLAEYACSSYVLKRVFARGGGGVRCAVLASPYLFLPSPIGDAEPLVGLMTVVKRGNRRELEALALNPNLPNKFYENLLTRAEYFAVLEDRDYQLMLSWLGDNPRLATENEDTQWDGYADYRYNRVFTVAWQLTATAPTTEVWATVLWRLLHKAKHPVGFENIESIIERWQIDPPRKEGESYYPGAGFDLRCRLADLLEPSKELLNSSDLALRQSFYRRFRPYEYKGWPDFLQKDGEHFVREAIQNTALWKSSEERQRLKRVTRECPDPNDVMLMPFHFEAAEKRFRQEHPEWFYDEENDEGSTDPNAVARRLERLLHSISEKLDAAAPKATEVTRPWWKR